jgi:hypothetical protein
MLLVGGGFHQAVCTLRKELWLDGCLGVEPRKDAIALEEGFCDFEGSHCS